MLLLAGLTGCAVTWDDVTSKEFRMAQLWTKPPEPMTVLETSTDGYARARALAKLEEAKGDPALHQKQMNMLQKMALTDRDPLCRVAAVRALGRFKDAQAGKILTDVYLGNPGLSPENNALIRQQALVALQSSSPAEAKQLFVRAARQPAGGITTTAQRDRLEILDERLAAIRALGHYKDPETVETLVKVLETDKDIAIRTCAQESLKGITHKDIPADGKMWREYIATGKEPPHQSPNMLAVFKRDSSAPAEDSPSVVQKIGNWIRPEPAPGQQTSMPTTGTTTQLPTPNFPTQPPVTSPRAPISTPIQPVSTLPPTAPTIGSVQSGPYRNPQGETVLPVGP
jgi:hypothetical protein